MGTEPLKSTYYRFFTESGSAMAIADKNGILVASNSRFNELIGSLSGILPDITSDSARLGSSFGFLPIHDAVRFSNLLSGIANGETVRMDFKTPYHDKSSNVHWFKIHAWKMSADPRVDLSGRGPFIGFILNDETGEREAEEKLHEDMRIAEKAMEAKSRFLATMSHEIRTPIQTITGMTELLEETSLNGEQYEYTRQIKSSAELLLALVNDILDYSKIEAGKMELERTAFSPGGATEEAADMLSTEIRKKSLAFYLDIPEETRTEVLGDPKRFRQVLINLISNAVKFTARGGVRVSLSVSPGADFKNKTLTVTVADTGIGITKEARERLFTTFMQADSSHTRRFGGTGLGLAISRNLVELMGGTIEMFPHEGGGSVFRFTIPIEPARETAGEAAKTGPVETETIPPDFVVPREAQNIRCENSRVLIVEDHPVNQQLFSLIMEKIGIGTLCAGDGLEALEKAGSNPVDLVFMDIQMPRMNGYEAAAELRRRGFDKPLIAVTAGAGAGERQRCLDCGFNDILFKPFKRRDIEAMYRKWAGMTAPVFPSGETAADDGAPAAVFSREELLDTFMDNEARVKPLLSRFIQRSAEQIEFLSGLEQKDWEEGLRIAHTIKGSAMTLSGMDLGKAAAALEKACRQGNPEAIETGLAALRESFSRFKSRAEEYLRQ
ncbi:MAG: response regulator [Treponema sp.]|jgi:signal transduction histidine kinase/HPt (histidine-containing phosphotransfer) domain-containing protein/ActR/RegA family two-component response regulator|nr:response regulator [Treponema sp.]